MFLPKDDLRGDEDFAPETFVSAASKRLCGETTLHPERAPKSYVPVPVLYGSTREPSPRSHFAHVVFSLIGNCIFMLCG